MSETGPKTDYYDVPIGRGHPLLEALALHGAIKQQQQPRLYRFF
jgi:hypothetical protein